MARDRPIILTLQLDAASDDFFQAQRKTYYPPALNRTGAHLTLFHNLPGGEFKTVLQVVGAACARQAPFAVVVAGLMKMGRGVAYRIESQPLERFRTGLANEFKPWLKGQDRGPFRPHATIQNKTSAHEADALFDHLSADFSAFEATAEGVQFWFFEGRGRAWTPAGAVAFAGA